MLALVHAAAGLANFLLNLSIVTAPFGTDGFDARVAKVNAVTRPAIGLPEGLAVWLVFRALYSLLPSVPGEEGFCFMPPWKPIPCRTREVIDCRTLATTWPKTRMTSAPMSCGMKLKNVLSPWVRGWAMLSI